MTGESLVDQEKVIGVDIPTVIQIAIDPTGQFLREAGVDAGVIVGVNDAIQVEIAVECVADEDGVGIDALAEEGVVEDPPTAVDVEDGADAGTAGCIGGGGAGSNSLAGPAGGGAVSGGADLIEDGVEDGLAGVCGGLDDQIAVFEIELALPGVGGAVEGEGGKLAGRRCAAQGQFRSGMNLNRSASGDG